MTDPRDTNEAICRSLGIDLSAGDVARVVVVLSAAEWPRVHVERHICGPDGLRPVFERLRLVPDDVGIDSPHSTQSQQPTAGA